MGFHTQAKHWKFCSSTRANLKPILGSGSAFGMLYSIFSPRSFSGACGCLGQEVPWLSRLNMAFRRGAIWRWIRITSPSFFGWFSQYIKSPDFWTLQCGFPWDQLGPGEARAARCSSPHGSESQAPTWLQLPRGSMENPRALSSFSR